MSYESPLLSLADLSKVKGLIIAHVNIRSLLPKIEILRHELVSEPVDILCVSETWLRPAIPDSMLGISGYSLERLDRTSEDSQVKKTGGGHFYP